MFSDANHTILYSDNNGEIQQTRRDVKDDVKMDWRRYGVIFLYIDVATLFPRHFYVVFDVASCFPNLFNCFKALLKLCVVLKQCDCECGTSHIIAIPSSLHRYIILEYTGCMKKLNKFEVALNVVKRLKLLSL